MQNNKTTLTSQELKVIKDDEFLLSKRNAINKVIESFSQLRELIDQEIENKGWKDLIPFKPGDVKISRGENYRGLPYVILDYPRQFSFEDIFAFRTMFWWGHFFSYTLHLQGHSYEENKEHVKQALKGDISNKEHLYLSVGTHPWEYHYGSDNYLSLSLLAPPQIDQIIEERDFIKVSTYKELQADLNPIIEEGSKQFCQLVGLLLD